MLIPIKKCRHNHQLTTLLILLLYIKNTLTFEFAPTSIQLTSITINTISTYTFSILRNYDTALVSTPWNTQLVPGGSTFDVYFPVEYLSVGGAGQAVVCEEVVINNVAVVGSFTVVQSGSPGSLILKIGGAVPTDTAIETATLTISGIINITPARTTSPFVIKIGNDYSANSSSASIAFQPASFISCGVNFNPTTVNTTGSMIVSVVLANLLPRNGTISIRFPVAMQWAYDISSSHQLSIDGNLTCQLQSTTSLTFLSGISCIGSQSTQTITVQPIYYTNSSIQQISSSTLLSFSISGLFSPPTTQSADTVEIISAYFISSQKYLVDFCDASITGLTVKTINNLTYSSSTSPPYVNNIGGFKINFIVPDSISRTDYFLIEFPIDSRVFFSFKLSDLNLGTAVYNSTTNSIIFYRTSSAVDNFIGQARYITFNNFQLPYSVRAIGGIRFSVVSARGFEKYVGVGSIGAVNKVYNSSLVTNNNSVSVISNYSLSFTLSDQLSTTAMIILTVPTTISVLSCPKLQPSSTITSTPTCTISSPSSTNSTSPTNYTITLTNLNATTSTITANQPLTIYFNNVTNYYSTIVLSGIGVKIYYTSDVSDLVAISTTNNVTLVPRSAYVVNFYVVNGNNRTLSQPVSYEISVNFDSGVPVGSALLKLQLQNTIKIGASTNTTHNCTIKLALITNLSSTTNQTIATLTLSTSPNSSFNTFNIKLPSSFTYPSSTYILIITLPISLQLRNPPTTSPVNTRITLYDNQTTPNFIDTGVIYTTNIIFQPMQISSLVISNKTSMTNMATSNYTFVVSVSGDVGLGQYVSGSILKMTVPVDIQIGATTRCYSTTIPQIDLNCQITNPNLTIPLDQILTFHPNHPTTPQPQNTLQFTYKLTTLTNPISFKPTTPFTFQILTPTSYHYAIDSSSLTTHNNISVQFNILGYQWNNTVYGGMMTVLDIYFDGVIANGLYSVQIDISKFSIIGYNITGTVLYPDCSSLQISGLNCTITLTNTTKLLTLTNIINSTSIPFPTIFNISLTNLLITPLVPPSIPNPYTISITGYDIQQYSIYNSANMVRFQSICTIPCASCPSQVQADTCLSCYTNTSISALLYLYNYSCYEVCPIHTFYTQLMPTNYTYTYTCSECSTNCNSCTNISSYCLTCYTNYSLYQHTNNNNNNNISISECVQICPNTTYQRIVINSTTNISIGQCLPCVAPCFSCINSSVICLSCLSTFYQYVNTSNVSGVVVDGGVSCLMTCPADITVANSTTMLCQYCITPCSLCLNNVNNCTSCITGYYKITNQLLSTLQPNTTTYGYTCLTSCPTRTLPINSTTCQQCTSPCSTCNNTLTQCLTCITGYYRSSTMQYTCVAVCEQYSFVNVSSGICQLCSTVGLLNCYDCINANQCNRCDDPTKPGYIYFPVNRTCLNSVPDGYINNSGIAQACTSNCTLCSITVNNCTACTGIYNLYINQSTRLGSCLDTCPSTYTNITNRCQKCLSPCLQCSNNLTHCTVCLSIFYSFNGACIEDYQCPIYYYLNQTTKSCTQCVSPCSACTNSTFCLICSTGVLMEDTGQCLVECPSTYAPVNTSKVVQGVLINRTEICLGCLEPCVMCDRLRENCTTCVSGYYYYPQLFRCYLPCPPDITIPSTQNSTLICLECTSPCRTCQNTTTTCLTCIQNYYLENTTCKTQCSTGKYPYNGICQQCVSPCVSCRSQTVCLSCIVERYLYQGGCVSVCPVHVAVVINRVCTACETGCVNCSTSVTVENSTCYFCSNPYALYKDHCYLTCPNSLILYLNTTQNKYYCLTSQQYAQAQLGLTLTLDTNNLLPLPFVVIGVFLSIITCMSRMQSRGTYIIGVLYCWFGLLEVGVLAYFLFGVYGNVDKNGEYVKQYKEEIYRDGLIGLVIIGVLNLLGLLIQSCYLWSDGRFRKWAKQHNVNQVQQQQQPTNQNQEDRNKKPLKITGTKIKQKKSTLTAISDEDDHQKSQCCTHKSTFIVITVLSALTSYKLKLLLFTGLFRFTGLSFPLDSVQKFRVFNLFSFMGMLQQGFIFYFVYLVAKQGVSYDDNKLLFLELVDVVAIYSVNFILAILSTRKQDDFFESLLQQHDEQQIKKLQQDKQNQIKQYLTQKKQKQIKNKLTSLHPDFIGMDSYHSLKNIRDSQERVQVGGQDQSGQFKQTQIYETGNKNQLLLNSNRKKLKDQKRYNSQTGGEIQQEQINVGREVNHNIYRTQRSNFVATGDWVEVDQKNKQFSYYNEEKDRTIINKRVTSENRSKLKSRVNNNQQKSELRSKPASEIKKSDIEKMPADLPKASNVKKQVTEEFYNIKEPQSYVNILYKKNSGADQDKNNKTGQKVQKIENAEIVQKKQKPQNAQKSSKPQKIVNKTTTILQVLKNDEKANSTNNKAVIISQAELEKNMADLSYQPILPFVHQDGKFKYREQNTKEYKNTKGKGSQKQANIFDIEPQSFENQDQDLVQVIQLQANKVQNKKSQSNSIKQLTNTKKNVQKQPMILVTKPTQIRNQDLNTDKKQQSKQSISKSNDTKINPKQNKTNLNVQILQSKNQQKQQIQELKVQKSERSQRFETEAKSKKKTESNRSQQTDKLKQVPQKQQIQKENEREREREWEKSVSQKSEIKSSKKQISQKKSEKVSIKQMKQPIQKQKSAQKIQNPSVKQLSQKLTEHKKKTEPIVENNKELSKKSEISSEIKSKPTGVFYHKQKTQNISQKSQQVYESKKLIVQKQPSSHSVQNEIDQDVDQLGHKSLKNQAINNQPDDHQNKSHLTHKPQPIKSQKQHHNQQYQQQQLQQQEHQQQQHYQTAQQEEYQLSTLDLKQFKQDIRDIPKIQPKKKDDVVKYYIYKGQKYLVQDDEPYNVNLEIQKKQSELSQIKNDINHNIQKINRRKSKQKLTSSKQQFLFKPKTKTSVTNKNKQSNQFEQENQSIQIDEQMLERQRVDPQVIDHEELEQENIYQINQPEILQIQSIKLNKKSQNKNQLIVEPEQQDQLQQIQQKSNHSTKKQQKSSKNNKNYQKHTQNQQSPQHELSQRGSFNKQSSIKSKQNTQKNMQLSNVKLTANSFKQSIPVKKQSQEGKNFSHAQFDHKITIVDNLSQNQSHNFTNSKPFQFDQSSLKKARFQFEQESEQKLSNPFDGSVHENTDEVLNQLHDNIQNAEGQEQEAEQLNNSHGEILRRQNNDQTVPIVAYHRNNHYNPITEANSEMQMSQNNNTAKMYNQVRLEGDDEQQEIERVQKQSNNLKDSNIKVVEVLKSNTVNFNKNRKKIPLQRKEQEERIKLTFDFPPSDRKPQEKQEALIKKQKMKYPLKQQPSNKYELHDSFEEESVQVKRLNMKQEQQPAMGRQEKYKNIQSEPQFLQKNKIQPSRIKNQNKVLLQGRSHPNLVEWKEEFAKTPGNYNPVFQGEEMDVPAKPIIDSQYEQKESSHVRDFDYEETDRSYHRGKLYMFQESPHIFERESQERSSSKAKNRSKSKNRRYSRDNNSRQKSSMNSLEKIYLQKLDKK